MGQTVFKLVRGIMEPLQNFQRQIEAAAFRIFPEVTQNIRQLKSNAALLGKFPGIRILKSKNVQRTEPDNGCDPIAVLIKLLKGAIGVYRKIHFSAVNQIVEVFRRY